MNADAIRHFFDYHFAINRFIWESYVTQLSAEQFVAHADYSHGSVRGQLVHLIEVDQIWFCELQNIKPVEEIPTAPADDREQLRATWNRIEEMMRSYLANLGDDALYTQPIQEPDEDRALFVWQVLLHVVNHGTDHRGQILRQLNDLGIETTSQDYIFYVYEQLMNNDNH